MKIYQTTVQQFRLNPVTDTIIPEMMDITDDIILNSNIDDAITEHKELVDFLGDDEIFYVTDLKTDAAICDEDPHYIHIVSTIEYVNDDYITKTIVETITREV